MECGVSGHLGNDENALKADGNEEQQLRSQLNNMEMIHRDLQQEKTRMEMEFGQKRAKFMELFMQKEDELTKERELTRALKLQNDALEEKLAKLQHELEESKSEVTIAECTMENEIEVERRKCQEELASLQQIMKDELDDASHTQWKYEAELLRLRKMNEKLDAELQEMKMQMSVDREGVLSAVTKSLAKRVTILNAHSQSNENLHENLDESMKKVHSQAQEDAEMLRSLLVPLEEEITALKDKLRETDRQLRNCEAVQNDYVRGCEAISAILNGKSVTDAVADLDNLVKAADYEPLNTDSASRAELVLHMSKLHAQRAFLQDEVTRLKKEFQEVCLSLELERREHNDLKQTWQMANDQFLETQRLQIKDLQQMHRLLNTGQKKMLGEIRKKDEDKMNRERKFHSLPYPFPTPKQSSPIHSPQRKKSPPPKRHMLGSRSENDVALHEGSTVERVLSVPADLSAEENLGLEDSIARRTAFDSEDSESYSSLDGSTYSRRNLHGLGEDLSVTGDAGTHESLMTPTKKRLVGERDWRLVQDELRQAREKLQRPCDMCSNYEAQLQRTQEKEKELCVKMQSLEKSIEWFKADLKNEQQYRQEVEEKLAQSTKDTKAQVSELYASLDKSQQLLGELRQQLDSSMAEAHAQLQLLTSNREQVEVELVRLQLENDRLVGKHSAIAEQMQNEAINMPDNLEEMHGLYLQQRDELITAKLAREHTEDILRSEIQFLKDQVIAEQHNKDSMEDSLTQEIDTLREKVGILESIGEQLNAEQKVHAGAKQKLQELDEKLAHDNVYYTQLVAQLRKDSEESSKFKEEMENEVSQLKGKVQTLKKDLENSEVVQKAFVKLSQSLQVQLEKIRGSEKEVRWQHEEDVDECNNCKQLFTVTKRRHHCRHCGKIFCSDCTSKVFQSGPNCRPSKVCDVCHTLLVPNTAPYFSNEPPQTPD